MSSSPLISIVIPAYNYAHTLERAVSSVYQQLDTDCEFIIINDGSTDDTQALLATFSEKYPNVQVLHKENGGLASTRNAGIRASCGDYLVFLDADDTLSDGAIGLLKQCIAETHAEFVIGGHRSIAPNGHCKTHLPQPLPSTALARVKGYLIDKTISFSNGGCAIKRSVFEKITYPEALRNAEDIPIFAYLMANCSCAQIQAVLVNVYKHADSLRHAFQHTVNVGTQIVEVVFDQSRMPAHLQSLKQAFMVQRLLSLSRSAYEAKHYALAQDFYVRAFKLEFSVLFKWTYTKKFISALIKLRE